MFPNEWSLSSSPFRRVKGDSGIVMGASREEAFARLCFVIEEELHCGLLFGPSGTGKSEILRLLGQQASRSHRRVVSIDMYGADWEELSGRLVEGFGLSQRGVGDSSWGLWRGIRDELTVRALAGIQTLLLVDHWEQAQAETSATVLRLIHLATGPDTRMTTIAATRTLTATFDEGELAASCDLHVPLRPFGYQETREYIQTVLRHAGAVDNLMTQNAVRRVYERTGGVVRAINRLCDLALLAGIADQCQRIDADVIDRVADEFNLPEGAYAGHQHAA